jgi:hypothetical protein
MAVTATPGIVGVNVKTWKIEATADLDTTITLDHGFPVEPHLWFLTPIQQVPAAASQWAVTGSTATQVTLTKGTGAGSGAVGEQVRLTAIFPGTRVIG